MKKIVGIIGGMGPLATSDLFNKIIKYTDANKDSEHIHILIDNNTSIPDRSKFILNGGESPLNEIVSSAKKLENAGADFLIIPCNTSHYLYDEIIKKVNIPIVNMIDEVAKYLEKNNIKKVGLLATTGTIKSGIYKKHLDLHNIETIIPNEEEQEIVMSFIYDEIKSKTDNYDLNKILKVVESLKNKGSEALILGCTELPIALNEKNTNMKCVDSTLILALKAIEESGYKVKEHI